DLLAFGVLEAIAISFEELMRTPLALDPDEQRLQIVHAFPQRLGAFREQTVGCSLEEEKRRPRLELRIGGKKLGVAFPESRQMLALFRRQALKDRPPAEVTGEAGGTCVELQPASLRGDRDSQRITGEHELGRCAVNGAGPPPGPALLAGAVDLDDGL